MSFFLAILLLMFVGDVVCWRVADRALRHLPRAAWWRAGNAVFFLTQLGILGAVLFLRSRNLTADLLDSKVLLSAVYIWHLVLLPLALLALIGWGVVAGGRRIVRKKQEPEGEQIDLTRRRFLAVAAGGAPTILCFGATAVGLRQIEQFRVRRVTLGLPGLPPQLDGLSIAHVTDIHLGRFTKGPVMERIVTTTNALNADLVLLTGDLINYEIRDLPLAMELTSRFRAAHGVYLCEGNHDLIEDGPQFVERMKRAGLRLLVNESATMRIRGADVQVLGLRWGGADRTGKVEGYRDARIESSMQELMLQRHEDVFPILLAHHPHAFDFAEGVPLTLGGHTHGGQIMVTENFGAGPAMYRYWSGLYRRDERALFVSNGVGNWLPLRSRAPAEIVHLTLRTATANSGPSRA